MTCLPADPDTQRARLVVMATSDVHMNLLNHDYYADRSDPSVGLSQTAALIAETRKQAMEEGAITLLLDNGDWLQGTPFGDLAIDQMPDNHPAMWAFQHLNYDAIGLGNHEFNFGLERLSAVLEQAHCPVLCSNLKLLDPSLDLGIQRSIVIERHLPESDPPRPPIRIGLFSVLPPQTMIWDADKLQGRIEIHDMVETARERSEVLRSAGADLIVAMAHTGVASREAETDMENALLPIAALPEVDAAIGGHAHLLIPSPTGDQHHTDIPVVMPGTAGSHLGLIELDLCHRDGKWHIEADKALLRPICAQGPDGPKPVCDTDEELTSQLAAPHTQTRQLMATRVGSTEVPLHSYFTLFDPGPCLALTAAAQAAAVRRGISHTHLSTVPLLSAVSPQKFGGRGGPSSFTNVPAGPLTKRNVSDIYLYPNELRCLETTGEQLRNWLEMSASTLNQMFANRGPTALISEDRVGYNFDTIYGVTYTIDLGQPCRFGSDGQISNSDAWRIRDLRYDGEPVCDGQTFAVALNSYRCNGGGNFRMLQNAKPASLPSVSIGAAVEAYLSGTLTANDMSHSASPWQFNAPNGAIAYTLTGPGARNYVTSMPEYLHLETKARADGFLELTRRF